MYPRGLYDTQNKHPLFRTANGAPLDLSTPSTIKGWWNFGSLSGICLKLRCQKVTANCNRTIPSHTPLSKHRHRIRKSETYLSRHTLRLTTTNTPCKRSLTILRLYLPTHRAKLILRIIQLYRHLIIRSTNTILNLSKWSANSKTLVSYSGFAT
jgi:hypothetical protein